MFRALQLAVGIVAVMIGVVLGVIVAAVWVPCVGAPMPLDPLASPDCVAAAAGGGTAWIGLLLWPIALAVAGFAAVRAIAHGRGPVSTVTVVLLLLVTAMPFAGHVRPMTAIAGALLEQGHRVTAYTGGQYADAFDHLGCDVVQWRDAQDFDERAIAETFPRAVPMNRSSRRSLKDEFCGRM